MLEAARLIVGIENLEKKISSSRWKNVKKNGGEAKEAAVDLHLVISNASSTLFPPSRFCLQTGIEEEDIIFRIIRLCVEFRVYDEVLDFLKDLMAYRHPRHSWEKDRKFSFLKELMSSSVLAEFYSTSRQTIINICSSLLKSWIKEICRLLNSVNGSIPIPIVKYRPDVFTCVKMFFLVEKNRLENEQWMTTQDLEPLIVKLPVSVLMDLVLLHEQEPMIRPNRKKSSVYFNWYRDLCRRLFRKAVPPVKSGNAATRLLNILLELGDEHCFKSFESNLCRAFLAPQSFSFLRIFLRDENIQRGIADSPIALDCFDRIVNSWAMQSESRVEPVVIWCRPKAHLPNHPQVERFLRSAEESMVYMNFCKITEARNFAQFLQNTTQGVSVVASGSGKSSLCFIEKFDYTGRNIDAEKMEVAALVQLRNRMVKKKGATKLTVIPPPEKRSKLDHSC